MLVKTKKGNFNANNANVLFDFLGIKKDVSGIQKLSGDVELITSVPIQVKKSEEQISELVTDNNENEGLLWTLSTYDLDRYSERIDPAGWDFSQYMKNPVIEWAHRYEIPAIGRAEGLFIDEKGLHGFIVFNDKSFDPFGWSIGERVKAGIIRAGSVGFRVLEIEIPDKETAKDGTSLIFRKQELLEFSICNVPANPFALMKSGNEKEKSLCDPAAQYWGGIMRFIEPRDVRN